MDFDVRITIISKAIVTVDADNMAAAKAIAAKNWSDDKYAADEIPPQSVVFETLYHDYSILGSKPVVRLNLRTDTDQNRAPSMRPAVSIKGTRVAEPER